MKKVSFSLLIFAFLLVSSTSFAHTFLKLGTYEQQGFKVEVLKTARDGIYEVRVLGMENGTPHFEDFFVNTFTWEVFKSPLGLEALNIPGRPRVRTYTMLNEELLESAHIFRWKYGGFLQSHDENITLAVAPEEGSILGIAVFNKEAEWKLPIGIHSPFQKIVNVFTCDGLLSQSSGISTTRP